MKSVFFFVLCCALLISAQEPPVLAVPVVDDVTLFVGTWNVVSACADGKDIPRYVNEKTAFIFQADGIVFLQNETVKIKFSYKLYQEESPKQIDVSLIEEANGNPIPEEDQPMVLGVYSITESQLVMCFEKQPNSEEGRPTQLASPESSEALLLVCEREKIVPAPQE